jgi:hypothetical protein
MTTEMTTAMPLLMSPQQMRHEQDNGHVRVLHRDIPEFCQWARAWWIFCPDGSVWLRVTDTTIADRLDTIKVRMDTIADTLACCRARGREDGPAPAGAGDNWSGWE